jgi:hypothetical protein
LHDHFKEEPMYLQVIDAILELDFGSSMQARKRARHSATKYFIEGGKLWRLGGEVPAWARAQRECKTHAEARVQAAEVHTNRGHFHCDGMKLVLMDKYHSPQLDESIISAIADCAKCKGFGPANLHSLMDPVLRRHPFELVVGDYLSLLVGIRGFKNVGLYLDTFTQHMWGFKYTVTGSWVGGDSGEHAWRHLRQVSADEYFPVGPGSPLQKQACSAVLRRTRYQTSFSIVILTVD